MFMKYISNNAVVSVCIALSVLTGGASAFRDEPGIFGDYFFNKEYNTLMPASRYVISMPGATSLRKHQLWINQDYSFWRAVNRDNSELSFRAAYGFTDYFEMESGFARGQYTDQDRVMARLRFAYPNHRYATSFGFMVSREDVNNNDNDPTVFSFFGSRMFFPNYSLHLAASRADKTDDRFMWQIGADLAISRALDINFVTSWLERDSHIRYDIGGRLHIGTDGDKGFLYINRHDLSSDFYQQAFNFGLALLF